MARVLTNSTACAMALESSRAVLPGSPTWFTQEPNEISQVGAEITTVARAPISKNRQRRKGTVVDLDSGIEVEMDTTLSALYQHVPLFLMSVAANADLTWRGAPATSSGYTIPAATAAQAAKVQWTAAGPITLLWAAGYANAANNGLSPMTADLAAAGVLLTVAGNVAETPPTNAEVSVCGIRAEAGDLAVTVSAGIATLTSGNGASVTPLNFTTLGWKVGQRIHIGGMTSTNRFFGAGPVVSYGSGRIRTIAAGTVTLDKIDDTLITSDGTTTGAGGTEVAVDILYGQFVRNVSVDSSEFAEQYAQFEFEFPDLFETEPVGPVAEPDGYIYAIANLANELSLNHPLTDKATMSTAFVGTDTEDPVDGGSRKTNADAPISPLFTEPFNTSADFLRLRIADTDDTGLTTDFKEVTITLNNNVSGERVLGTLGAKYLNFGNFEVDIDAVALFSNAEVPARIRANTTVTMDWMMQNADGVVAWDVPSMTMSSDGLEFPINESVQISLPCQAFVDSFFGTSVSASFFPMYPTS